MPCRCGTNCSCGKKIYATISALGEKNRLTILHYLSRGEKSAGEIWQRLDLPQNLASHHLKILKENGLIKAKKDGQQIFYSLDKKTINQRLQTLKNLLK